MQSKAIKVDCVVKASWSNLKVKSHVGSNAPEEDGKKECIGGHEVNDQHSDSGVDIRSNELQPEPIQLTLPNIILEMKIG